MGFFDGVDPRVKTGIAVAGGVGALYVAYRILKKDESASLLPATAAEELKQQPVPSTITTSQAQAFASALVTAFDDCGTDNDVVDQVFGALQNKSDLLLLISVYGVRDYKGCFDGDYFSMHSYNLSQALTSELSGSELAALNAGLKAKNITYSF